MSVADNFGRAGLHALLWHRASDGVLRIEQKRLADELGCSRFTINRVLAVMADEGRISKIDGATGPNARTFEITDPDSWSAPDGRA